MTNSSLLQVANEVFNTQQRLRVVTLAIDIAKAEKVPTSKVKKLHQERTKLVKKITTKTNQLLSRMVLACNIQSTSKSPWVYVRCQDSSTLDTVIVPLPVIEGCLESITLDNREVPMLSTDRLESLMPVITDQRASAEMESQVAMLAVDELKSMGIHMSEGMAVPHETTQFLDKVELPTETIKFERNEPEAESQLGQDKLIISLHIGKRYVQRVLGMPDESVAEAYYRNNSSTINKDITDTVLNDTEQIWKDEGDQIDYLMDSKNIVYVIGYETSVPTAVTLYELDFGFNKDINRLIAKEQITVLREKLEGWKSTAESTRNQRNEAVDKELAIDSDLAVLRAQIRAKEAEKRTILARVEEMDNAVAVAEQEFRREHAKLFKKWMLMEGMK